MNLVKIGRYLKSIREKKDIRYEEVYEKTRIQTAILEDIEEGTSKLPLVFLKGFLRTYAKFLKVDIEEYLKEEPQEEKQLEPTPQETPSQSKTTSSFKKKLLQRAGLATCFLVILLFLFNKEEEETKKTPQEADLTKKNILAQEKSKPLSLLEKVKQGRFQQEILIRSSQNLEIYFKVDDQKLETRNLTPKEWYKIKAINKIYLRFEQAKDVQIFYNGKRLVFKGQFFEKSFSQ